MLKALITRLASAIAEPRNLICFFAGFSLVWAYAPYSEWWIALVAIPLWLSQIHQKTRKTATVRSYFFGLGWFGAGISWVHVSIDQFGGMPLPASLFLMFLLCAYLALFPALAAWLTYWLSEKLGKLDKTNVLFIPVAWTATEWLRGWLLTGFPWLSFGYSQIDAPFASLAPLIGEVGITLALVSLGAATVLLAKRQFVKTSIALIAISFIATIVTHQLEFTERTGETKTVALVQGNIPQELKWAPEQEWPTMLKYLDLTRQHYPADLIVWPESAIPSVEPVAAEYLDLLNSSAALNNTAVVTGIINFNFESKEYFNSLIVLGKQYADDTNGSYYYPNGNRFYKYQLLPIGEFVPFQEWLRPIAPLFNLPMSSFSRGAYVQPNLMANGIKIAPLICFEIAFPEQLHANFYTDTQLLLTVSNDTWFGTSHGPHQHMEIARMRALEFGRPLVRSTNTGVTAVVDEHGQMIAQLPQFEEAVLKADVSMVDGRTPFSRYQRYPAFLLSLLMLLGFTFLVRQSTNRK